MTFCLTLPEVKHSSTSNIVRVFISNSSVTTGAGLTGLTNASAGLSIYCIPNNAAGSSGYAYTASGSLIETITTCGTYAAPSASKCRFKELDATYAPGWYELQFLNSVYATASATALVIHGFGATNMRPFTVIQPLVGYDPNDSVRMGMTALPNAAAEASGGLYTRGTGAGQIKQDSNGTITTLMETAVSGSISTASFVAGAITAAVINTGAIDADAIADGAIDAGAIAAGAITNAKFASSAIDASVLATGTITSAKFAAGAIDAAAIASDAITSAKVADGFITAAKLASDTITAAKIASDAITAAKIASDAITSAKIADGAIDAATFADNAITAAKIADGAIDAATFAAGAINAAAIASDAITAAKIADGAIDAGAIASDAITAAKIATGAIDADALAADAVAEIADGVCDEALAGHTTAGSVGKALSDAASLAQASQIVLSTTIATLASQTSFTLTAGSADDAAYQDLAIIITDSVTSTQKSVGYVAHYTGASKTVRLLASPVFTIAAGDSVQIITALGTARVHTDCSLTSSAGSAAHVATWLEYNGAKVDITGATVTVAARELSSDTNLFSITEADLLGATAEFNDVLRLLKSSPGFTDDRTYVFTSSIVHNSRTFVGTQLIPCLGGA